MGIILPCLAIFSQSNGRLDSLELELPNVESDSLRMTIYHEIIWEFSRMDTDRALRLNADFMKMALKNKNENGSIWRDTIMVSLTSTQVKMLRP